MKLRYFISYLILSTLFIFLLLEASLRFLYTPLFLEEKIKNNRLHLIEKDFRINFDKEKYRFYPLSKGEIYHMEYNYKVNHDIYGYRNPCFENYTDFRDTIFVVGDSFLYGIGLENKDILSCAYKNSKIYTLGIPGAGFIQYEKLIENLYDIIKNKNSNREIVLISYLGNDFESLVNYNKIQFNYNNYIKENNYTFKEKIVFQINRIIMTNKFTNQSYLINLIKYLLSNQLKEKNSDFVSNNSGDTFYKKNIKNTHFLDIKKSLKKFLKKISEKKFILKKIILIPSVSDIDKNKIIRDSILYNFKISDLDLNYKYNIFLNACIDLKINCVDTRKYLDGNDYYEVDNHLKASGIKKIKYLIN